jgi:hypothetical protein
MHVLIYKSVRRATRRAVSTAGTALETVLTLVWHQALRSICFASRQAGTLPHPPSDHTTACVCDGALVGSFN